MLKKKKKRSMWIRKWIGRSQEGRAWYILENIEELGVEDPHDYVKFMRMTELKFEELLDLVTPIIRE